MFYITPANNTGFDLDQVLYFNYFYDEEKQDVDKTCIVIVFKNGSGIKIKCKTEEIANEIFCDLCKYLNIINKPKRTKIK